MVFKLKLKCSSLDGWELLRVSQQTMLRCSVENWPEVGMEWLLVTFVTTLSVKWRLMTSFYKMSNKLFEETRKRNNHVGIKEKSVHMWNISIVFICSLNKAIVDKVLHRKKWCWSDSIAQILFLQQQNLVADIVKQCYPKPPIPAVFLHDVTLFVAFYIRPLFVNLGQSRSFVIIFNISGLVNIFKRFGWESFCSFIY